ncbi:MAG: ribonuclease E [Candidatus Azotimanducaceae bacterium]|jgi:ribonuclease E
MVDGQQLYDLDIESRAREQKKSNIYKARITRVEPSLEAAFVDYGGNRHGFLPLKEISREYFSVPPSKIKGRVNIAEVVKEGTEIVIQVEKEERGNKGAALTTFCSLAGRYLVLMPNNPRAGGISRRIEGEERDELKSALSELEIPKDMGVIIRTAGIGRTSQELQWDLDYLVQISKAIDEEAAKRSAPFLIYQESDVIIRAIRDYLRDDIGEILIDTDEAFGQAEAFIDQVMPQFKSRLKRYESDVPLFNRYQIEGQIESAFQREVRLPSGGSLVIDPTEALVSIDINSSRATRGSHIEDTAVNTNLEAADEICRQLRLRDMGGLVVIDFIDMNAQKNQRAVETRMRDALQIDRARVQVGRISKFGLLEMSRQRLRPSLVETSGIVCPRCSGTGTIRDIESSALAVMRLIEEEALKDTSSEIRAFVPISVGSFMLNEKRSDLSALEARNEVRVVVVPSADMETPHFRVERIRSGDEEAVSASYEITQEDDAETVQPQVARPVAIETAAVKAITAQTQTAPAPTPTPVAKEIPKQETKPGLMSRLISSLFSSDEEPVEEKPAQKQSADGQNRNRGNNRSRRRGGNNSGSNNGNNSGNNSGNNGQNRSAERNQDTQKPRSKPDQNKSNNDASDNDRNRKPTDDETRPMRRAKPAEAKTEIETEKPQSTRNENRPEDNKQGDDDKRNQGTRRRGGKGRRSQNRPTEQENVTETAETIETPTAVHTEVVTTPPVHTEVVTTPPVHTEVVTTPPVHTEVVTTPEVAPTPAPEVVATPEVEPTPAPEAATAPEVAVTSETEPAEASVSVADTSVAVAQTPVAVAETSNSSATIESPKAAAPEPVAEQTQEEHPSELGRASNDPRDNPVAAPTGTVLGIVDTKAPAEVLIAEARSLDVEHASTLGRATNDPRGRGITSPVSSEETEETAQIGNEKG